MVSLCRLSSDFCLCKNKKPFPFQKGLSFLSLVISH
nr:MAG TPA: hypothetical protein [Caudoviricetes sp.]